MQVSKPYNWYVIAFLPHKALSKRDKTLLQLLCKFQ